MDGTFGQSQFVGCVSRRLLVGDLGFNPAAGSPVGTGGLDSRCNTSEFAAVVVEVPALGIHLLFGRVDRHGSSGFFTGHVQHGTRFDAVEVAFDKCVGVGLQQCDQHLVEGHTGWFVGRGNLAGGVATLNGHTLVGARTGSGCNCGRAGGWWCHGGSRAWCGCDRRGRARGPDGLCRGGGHPGSGGRRDLGCSGDGGRGTGYRRVEQQGVVAHGAACGPVGVQHQVEKRLVDGAVTGDAQHGAAVRALLQCQTQTVQGRVVFEARRFVGFGRSNGRAQRLGFGGIDLGNVDFCPQWLTQTGQHGQAAQGQRVGIRGRQAHGAGQRNSASNGGKPGSEWCSHGWKRSLNAVGRLYFSCHIGTHFVTNL